MNNKIKVYVKLNENNEIINIASSIFLNDVEGWIEIDAGYGDNFAHAQSKYLRKRLMDEQGRYNYKLVDGIATEIAEEDKPVIEVIPQITTEERIATLELELNTLLGMGV